MLFIFSKKSPSPPPPPPWKRNAAKCTSDTEELECAVSCAAVVQACPAPAMADKPTRQRGGRSAERSAARRTGRPWSERRTYCVQRGWPNPHQGADIGAALGAAPVAATRAAGDAGENPSVKAVLEKRRVRRNIRENVTKIIFFFEMQITIYSVLNIQYQIL